MKVTIKKKQKLKGQSGLLFSSQAKNQSDDQRSWWQRHVLIRPHNKQQKLIFDLIKIDYLNKYSKVQSQTTPTSLVETIVKTVANQSVRYDLWIGYLCTHCCYHFKSLGERMGKIYQFVEKYRVAYQESRCAQSIYKQTLKRIKTYCNNSSPSPSDSTFQKICRKYQETLLLQFIPIQYSKYVIQRYISNDGDIQQYVRLCTSLSHFTLNTCHPINEGHFVDLMLRPYMGIVQWPIVISNRHMFQSEPTNSPLYQPM